MSATPLEVTRLVIASAGMLYVYRGAWQMARDYSMLKHATGRERSIARLNAMNAMLRAVAMFGMWSVALLAVIFTTFAGGWVIYSQTAYTVTILCMMLVARNIRRAQTAVS